MPAFKPLALGAFLFSAADGARVAKKRAATIAGVPVHNYHQAFNNDRWDASFLQAMSQMKQDNEEHWLVMLRAGLSDSEIDHACAAHKECETRGHAGGVPFIEVKATLKELEQILASEKDQVDFVEPNMPMSATPEMPASQDTVPWGLRRTRSRDLESMPRSDPGARNGGKGVNAYVMDTGIRTTHVDFEGRAIPAVQTAWFGFRLQVCAADDTNCALDKQGHGTHCARSQCRLSKNSKAFYVDPKVSNTSRDQCRTEHKSPDHTEDLDFEAYFLEFVQKKIDPILDNDLETIFGKEEEKEA